MKIAELDPEIYIPNTEVISSYFKKFSIRELKEITGLSHAAIKDIRANKSSVKLGFLKKVSNKDFPRLTKEIKYLVGKTNSHKIKIPKRVTRELAYLMGAFRDGSLSRYKFEFEIAQKNKNWIEYIKQILKKEFELETKVKFREKDKCYYIRVRSRALFKIIEVIFGYSNECWDTPKEVIKCNNMKILREYVSGFWDTEGSYLGVLIQCWYDNKHCPPLDFVGKVLAKDGIYITKHKPSKTVNYYAHRIYIPYKHRLVFKEKYNLRRKTKYPFIQ